MSQWRLLAVLSDDRLPVIDDRLCVCLRWTFWYMTHRVLVIEDDRAIRELLMALVIDEGYEVRGAANGADGLASLEWLPEVILLDMMMPVMDGPTFRARQLALPTPFNAIPVIVLTARQDAEAEIASMRVSGAILKPFNETRLLRAIESALPTTVVRPGAA